MQETFLHKIGTIVVNIHQATECKPIAQPRALSLKFSFLPKIGNKEDTKE